MVKLFWSFVMVSGFVLVEAKGFNVGGVWYKAPSYEDAVADCISERGKNACN